VTKLTFGRGEKQHRPLSGVVGEAQLNTGLRHDVLTSHWLLLHAAAAACCMATIMKPPLHRKSANNGSIDQSRRESTAM